MKVFKDNAGREWLIEINVDALKRVKSLLGVNLLDAAGGDLLEKLVSDPVLLCDVIYALVKPEADNRNVPAEDFGRGMAGDAIEKATEAVLEELVNFFPSGKRRVLARAMGKLRELEAVVIETAEKRLQSPELENRIRAKLKEASGSWPEPSESTPGR